MRKTVNKKNAFMTHRTQKVLGRNRLQGFSLIEALVSIVILSLGVLGVAALQASSLRNNESASQRSMAIVQAYSILDAMRTNATQARDGAYNFDGNTCSIPNGTSQRDVDIAAWINNIKAEMGDTACGGIELDDGQFTIRILWNDSRATGGSATEFVDVEARL